MKEVLVLVGTDSFLIGREIARLKKGLFNFDSFSAKTDSTSSILDSCLELPLMGDKRFVLVKDADAIKKEDYDLWLAYFKKPSPSSILVLIADKIDNRLKLWKEATELGFVVLLKTPYPHEMSSWIMREASPMGLQLEEETARLLADCVGTSPTAAVSELEKLQTFIFPRLRVTIPDIEALSLSFGSKNIFDLVDAVGARHFQKAGSLLDELVLQGEPYVRILFMMVRHFRLLFLAKEAVLQRRPQIEIAKLLGVSPYFVKDYLSQAEKISFPALRQTYGYLLQTDRSLKGSRLSNRQVMYQFLMKVCLT